MTLSSSEAGWVVLSEADNEVMFIIWLLQRMKTSIKLPFMEKNYSMKTIFIAGNDTAMTHNKQVDISTSM